MLGLASAMVGLAQGLFWLLSETLLQIADRLEMLGYLIIVFGSLMLELSECIRDLSIHLLRLEMFQMFPMIKGIGITSTRLSESDAAGCSGQIDPTDLSSDCPYHPI
jgi:hypothetical protein